MLVESLMWYSKLRGDLEDIGFEFNPYDPCVANIIVNDKKHTTRFHVNDLLSSHIVSKVDEFVLKRPNKKYGTYGELQSTCGKVH